MENIKTIALKYITFSKDLQLVYFEFFGKRYDIKCTKDIYDELVKLLVEKYSDLITYQDNKLILQRNSFKLELYKKENLPTYTKTRHIFSDWYLITHFPIAQLEKKIREIVSAFDFDDEKIIIGYYPKKQEERKQEQEMENKSKIKEITLKEITFSDDLNFAYFEVYEKGEEYGFQFDVQNIKDIYEDLVKLFVEKYPNCLIYNKNYLSIEKDNFILRLYKEKYFSNFALKFGYIRNIFEDWYLYVQYPIFEFEQKIKKIVSAMELNEEDVIFGYYANEKEEEQIEEQKEEERNLPAEIENTVANIQTTTLRDITFSKDVKLACFEVFGNKYSIKGARDIYCELVKFFIEKYPNSLTYEGNKLILDRYAFSLELSKIEDLPKWASPRHIIDEYYLYTNYDLPRLEKKIREISFFMDLDEKDIIIGYYPNDAVNPQPLQIEQSKQVEVLKQNVIPQEIEKPKIFTNFDSNIQTTTLRDITFSKDVKLACFEVFGNKYSIKGARDIYCELVKFFIEKYKKFLSVEDNKIILKRYDFKLELYKKEDIPIYATSKHILGEYYLNTHGDLPSIERKIRDIVSVFNIPEEEVIIGYYPNDAVSFPNVEVKENQVVNFTPVKTKPEQPKEDMLLFSSDLKKIKNKFFDYLLNVKNFEEVKAKNYTLAFNFYCYSNNISFSLNNVAYFEEQIANDELLSANEIIANRTREVFPVFLDFLQYTKEQKEKKLETIKTNCVSILKEKFANGYRVSESAKIDYKKFCNFYKNKFDKELELEREELNDFLKSFTFLYLDTIYLPEFVISEETKNNLFDFIEKCFSEHKFAYYDTIYNKFSSEFYGGMITTHEILKKYLLEINGKEINFKDNGDYISVLNENIDFNYIFKHFENWFCDVGRVVKMDEIENNFFNMANYNDDKKNNRIKDFVRDNKKIILNSYSKENGSDYFHLDIIYLTNQDVNKIGEFFKNRIQNGQFISDEEFFTLLRNNEEFSERYDFVSDLGLKKYFQIKLDKILRFRNQKVELRSSYVSYDDIIEKFVDNKKKFELEDVKNLMKDLNYSSFDQIYQKIAECATRISENEFISNENIDFLEYIDEIDSLISEFCGDKKYVFIKDVTVFAGFPNVGYAWNKFLLESYVNRYSRRYKLLNTVFFRKNVYGVIVDKKSNLTLNDCLADVLLDSSLRVEEEAVKYLVENDYLYKVQNISDVMAKVRER